MSEYQEEETKNIVLDLGSGYMKCGFGGDDSPRSIFKNVVGRPRADAVGVLNSSTEGVKLYVGEEASANASILDLEYCIVDGKVESWSAFEACVGHAIETELRASPKEYNVLLTEAPSNEIANRNRMFGIMFETFEVAATQCQVQAILALYASGRTTGMVVDSGDGVTHTVPVFQGYATRNSVEASRNAGRNINKGVLKYLNKFHGRDFRYQPNGIEIARDIKESACRMALNFKEELEELAADKSKAVKYEFQDGSTVDLAEVQIQPAEVIWAPREEGIEVMSLRDMIGGSLSKTDINARNDMYLNTVLSGGTTCLPGFIDRTEKEYKELVPTNAAGKVKLSASEERKYSVFNGGSILVELSTFQERWITKEAYEEEGVEACNKLSLF